MSDIKDRYAKAQAHLASATKRWEDAVDESKAFQAVVMASRLLLNGISSRKGRSNDLKQAKANHEMTASAFFNARREMVSKAEVVTAAKAALEQMKERYDDYLAAETKRAKQAELYRKRAEARLRAYEERKQAEDKRRAQEEQMREEEERKRAQDDRRRREKQQEQGNGGHSRKGKDERPHQGEPVISKPTHKISVKDIQDWHQACVAAFLDKTNMRTFPKPPSEPCSNMACALEKKDRALKACTCNLRKIFGSRSSTRDLKQDRVRFHPDKFASTPEVARDAILKRAKEVFVVVDAMYQRR